MTVQNITASSGGAVQVDDITIIATIYQNGSAVPIEVDIRNLFAELNIYEDLFSNAIYGNILLGDSWNLLQQLQVQGLEGLRVSVRTPGMDDSATISKTFGIYSVTDQQPINFDRYQSYRLHFASLEMLGDALNKPLNREFDGSASSLVPLLYNQFFASKSGNKIPRNIKVDPNGAGIQTIGQSELKLGATKYDGTSAGLSDSTKLKFIATNWTPLKTLNWIANKTVPNNKALGGTCVFYESNKFFHFASLDDLIDTGKKDTAAVFTYKYDPANMASSSGFQSFDVVAEYSRVLNIAWTNNFNILDNMNMGYFGGQIRSIDPILKRYREQNYSFENAYQDFKHTVDGTAYGMFPKAPDSMLGRKSTLVDPRRNIVTRPSMPYFLFDNEETPLTSHKDWLSQRAARMASLSNFSINVQVNGRSDMKVGDMITFKYPNYLGNQTPEKTGQDPFLTDFFLVAAIRHFISPIKYLMSLELVKDTPNLQADSPLPSQPSVQPSQLATGWETSGA